MGNVSLSHCKYALTKVWYKSKISNDIEKTDKYFNHIKFSKKYFYRTNKLIHKKLKKMILNQWCAFEAAIK